MSEGFEYGNTRLRARRARLLSPSELSGLTASETMTRFQNALADLDYGPDVEAALLRYDGLRLIDSALSRNLARTFRSLRSFYSSDMTEIDLLLGHWDLHNLRTILRGQAQLQGPEEIVPLLVPAARLTEGALIEVASQPGLRAVVDLMVAWGIPSRSAARRLLHDWPAYEMSGNAALLEETLHHGFASDLDAALNGAGGDLNRALRTEYDAENLILALRLRRMRLDREPIPPPVTAERYLPGGLVSVSRFEAIESEDQSGAIVERLGETAHIPGPWQAAAASWAEHGDLVTLAEDLQLATIRSAVSLFQRGDPLGIAVPIAYVRAKENEVRNLRVIGRGIVHHVPAPMIDEQMRVT